MSRPGPAVCQAADPDPSSRPTRTTTATTWTDPAEPAPRTDLGVGGARVAGRVRTERAADDNNHHHLAIHHHDQHKHLDHVHDDRASTAPGAVH